MFMKAAFASTSAQRTPAVNTFKVSAKIWSDDHFLIRALGERPNNSAGRRPQNQAHLI